MPRSKRIEGVVYDQSRSPVELARLMIEREARPPIVEAALEVPIFALRRIWRDVHGDFSPRGRTPADTASLLWSQRHAARSALFLHLYLGMTKRNPTKVIDLDALIAAWDDYTYFFEADEYFDFTSAWYVCRDVRTGLVEVKKCNKCHSYHLYNVRQTALHECPLCRGNKTMIGKARPKKFRRKRSDSLQVRMSIAAANGGPVRPARKPRSASSESSSPASPTIEAASPTPPSIQLSQPSEPARINTWSDAYGMEYALEPVGDLLSPMDVDHGQGIYDYDDYDTGYAASATTARAEVAQEAVNPADLHIPAEQPARPGFQLSAESPAPPPADAPLGQSQVLYSDPAIPVPPGPEVADPAPVSSPARPHPHRPHQPRAADHNHFVHGPEPDRPAHSSIRSRARTKHPTAPRSTPFPPWGSGEPPGASSGSLIRGRPSIPSPQPGQVSLLVRHGPRGAVFDGPFPHPGPSSRPPPWIHRRLPAAASQRSSSDP